MKHFLNQQGQHLLEALSFTKTLYAFDFDGTLAPIVPKPMNAHLNQQTETLLSQLCSLAPVAVISGRSRKDLKTRIPKNVPYTVGNHGLEGVNIQEKKIQKAKEITALWKQTLQSLLKNSFFDGVELEDKVFSLALHYRNCRKKKEVKSRLLHVIGDLKNSPRIILGKSVLNLIPVGAPHKGMALLELMVETGASRALYVGDDDTDEDIFSLPDDRIFSVRVGQKKISHAKYYLRRQSEINSILKRLIRFHTEKKS